MVAVPIKKYVINPIKRYVSYAFKCDSHVQGLQEQIQRLQDMKDRLQQSVDDATRNGEVIFPNVTQWLITADKDIREACTIIQGEEDVKNKCFFGLFPNLKTRFELSTDAVKKALVIDKLCNEERLDSISFRPPEQQIVEPSPSGLYNPGALPSRVLILNKVMDALKDPNLDMVGVYGVGGVGKSTLAKEVRVKALQEKLFETVIMVAVTRSPKLKRIQGEIASFLGIKLSAEEIPERASQLHKRLENSKVLIILDDLWQKLELNAIGIPSHWTSAGRRCKIMLTSRTIDVLSSYEIRALKVFALDVLSEEETLSLFQMSVAEAKDPEFHDIATQIARRCVGLPLLIQIVAKELTNTEYYQWREKLSQLSVFGEEFEGISNIVLKVLESSYENLPGNEIKSFFLLCALFGQSNIQIWDLLTHSMGLGLFERNLTMEAARDNVFALINKLKAKSLLLDGDMDGYVKIHDTVRDAALSVASKVQHAFIGSGEVRFRDWPDKACTRISLPFCSISELPVGLDCPMAEVFLLYTEDLSLRVPDSFFARMTNLNVVDFRGLRLVSFPSSIHLLGDLRTLYLNECQLDDVAVLGELQQLELLSFASSKIVELPREIKALTRLKLLDLRDCSNLQVIPANLISRLRSLEELYMLNSFVRWDTEGNANLVELEYLDHLSTLEIQIPDLELMTRAGFRSFNRLRNYKISIGSVWDWNEQYERSKVLKLKVEKWLYLEDNTESLLRNTEELYLNGVSSIESIFCECFPKLKHMHVENDFDIQHLTTGASFPVLESLYLDKLYSMEKICCGQLRMGSFGELQILKISNCDKLTSLFSFPSYKCLQQLRELEVELCERMETVVEDVHHNNAVIEFTQLSSLKLKKLPNLTGFCKLIDESEPMRLLFSNMVSFPNLTSLEVNGCHSLKHIFTASMVKCLIQLKNLKIKDCESVEEIIQSRTPEEIEEEGTKTIVFPKLDSLSLVNLKKLKKRFRIYYSFEFPLLTELTIEGCDLFNKTVIFSNLELMDVDTSSSDEKLLVGLQPHPKINRINFKYYKGERLPSWMPNMKSLSRYYSFRVLNNLVDLKLEWCYNCVKLPCLGNLPHLRFMEMNHMGKVKCIDNEFYGIDYERSRNGCSTFFPALESLYVTWMENLTEWSSPSDGKRVVAFPRLQNLSIQSCPKLTGFPMSDLSELVRLEIKDCEELKLVIDEKKPFAFLTGLSIKGSSKFTHLRNWLLSIKSFKELSVRKCEWLTFIPYDLQKVSYLTSLEIYCCRRLRYFPEDILSELTKLRTLRVGGFSEELDDFRYLNRTKDLPCLEELEIWGSDFVGREMCSLPKQLQHLSVLKSLKIMGFTAMEALPERLTNLQSLRSLSLDYCRNLRSESTTTIVQRLPNLLHLSVRSCPIVQESESEWLNPLQSTNIEVELSHVSKVGDRL